MDSLLETRKKQLMGGVSAADSRLRRARNTIKIGKSKRLESMQKRRGACSAAATAKSNAEVVQAGGSLPKELSVENLPLYYNAVTGTDASLQFEGVHYIRRLLSKEQSPPTEAVLKTGVLPYLVAFLDSTNSRMQFEACWAVTNIASTQYTKMVVDSGAVPKLVALLKSGDVDVREQSIWCLGNVAGDGAAHRDVILAVPDAVQNLLLNLQSPGSLSLLRNAAWALSNLCRGKPTTPLAVAQAVGPALTALVGAKEVDKEVLQDALWGLSYITDASEDHIGTVAAGRGIGAIVGRLSHTDTSVVIPALRTAGNMVTGSDEQTQAVLDGGFVPHLAKLIAHSRRNVRREACWAASNIAAGTSTQISALVAYPGVVSGLVEQLDAGEWHVRKEAAWALCNVASSGVSHHIDILVAGGIMSPLAKVLTVEDARVVQVALEAVEGILKLGKQYADAGRAEDFAGMWEDEGGVDALEDLQSHSNDDIFKKAVHIMETYLGVEGDEEVENTGPALAATGTFAFGAPAALAPSTAGTNTALVPAAKSFAPPALGVPTLAPPTGGFNFSNVTFS